MDNQIRNQTGEASVNHEKLHKGTGDRKRRHFRIRITRATRARLIWCLIFVLLAGMFHTYRWWNARSFYDQREASRWDSAKTSAQVSAFLSPDVSMTQENIKELEFKINQRLVQDSVIDSEASAGTKGWTDCYSAQGSMTISANGESIEVDAVGTGGEFFLFHPVTILSGHYYESDSLMKDEILIDEETAWKLFGSNDIVGRIVEVEDTTLVISGVYHREDNFVEERAGRPSYMVYVSYKSLLQFGAVGQGAGNLESGEESEGVAAAPAKVKAPILLTRSPGNHFRSALHRSVNEGPVESASPVDPSSSSVQEDTATEADSSGNSTGNGSTETETLPDGAGTANTKFEDSGAITCYEVVMPNPVDGYAKQVLSNIIGTKQCAIVDNTNRYRASNFAGRILSYGTWSMRQMNVRFPYWENVAIQWEEIFTLLFAVECLLLILTAVQLLLTVIGYFRHKTWTIAGNIHSIQEQIYERQSKKRYPEYYEKQEQE